MSRSHDEIIEIFKHDAPIDVVNNYLKSYLTDIDCLQEFTDKFDMIQQTLKEEGYDSTPFHVIKHYLMEYKETFVTIEETNLIES